jgi:hypothetical protein
MALGGVEILIMLAWGLLFLAIPVAGLVLLVLIYQKVARIERRLNRNTDEV